MPILQRRTAFFLFLQLPFAVGIGAFFGAILRYATSVSILTFRPHYPLWLGTVCVNLLGSFAIGLLIPYFASVRHPLLFPLVITGFLGGLTTFSTFAFDGYMFFKNHQYFMAIGYLGFQVIAGLCLVALGCYLSEKYFLHDVLLN